MYIDEHHTLETNSWPTVGTRKITFRFFYGFWRAPDFQETSEPYVCTIEVGT